MTDILIYIVVFLVGVVVILAAAISTLLRENEELLGRRDRKLMPEQMEDSIVYSLKDTIIPDLQDEIERWELAYETAMKMYERVKTDNEILQSDIAKLRKGGRAVTNHNGICLTCYFKNDCSMTEGDIFRDDTKQVADCGLYMKETTPKEESNDTEMQKM